MEALQYTYTSWKNGDSAEKGYMIYSRSEGITEAECSAIKDAMQYLAPKGLNLTPTAQEIADVFPYSFSYFVLPTGRGCVAQSTYLGKDYSGRFGNYIIYALVFDRNALPCRPAEFFAEPYIKTAMTDEELNASSPVPPLPPLPISQYGSVINDEQLNEFLFDKEEEFAQVIAMVLAARDAGVPFYLNDTRENLVLWSAAVQRIFPLRLAKAFTFNTYVGDPEALRSPRIREEGLNFHLIGVRPDANYFSYAAECRSNRHMVMDFADGHMTQGIEPTHFARAMAASLVMDYEEADAFGAFLDTTSFSEISGRLEAAYLYYLLLQRDEFQFSEEHLRAILSFGAQYCSEADNSRIGSRLLVKSQENGWVLSPDTMAQFWSFACRYADFMLFTLFDLLQETLYQSSGDAAEPCAALDALLQQLSSATPQPYKKYLDYLNSAGTTEQLLLYLTGHKNLYTNHFYIHWLLRSYPFADGLQGGSAVSKLLSVLLHNLTEIGGSERSMVEILFAVSAAPALFEDILHLFLGAVQSPARLDRLCAGYVEAAEALPEEQMNRFEQLLLETPGAAPLAARLCVRKVEAASHPDQEFWRIYENLQSLIVSQTGFSVDSLVLACLNRLDENAREKAAIDMIRRLDLTLLRDAETIRALTNIIDRCSVKSLAKLGRDLLQQTCRLRAKVDPSGLEKVRAVCAGESLEASRSLWKRPGRFFSGFAQTDLTLKSFPGMDYETYVKYYFDAFFSLLQKPEDAALLMRIFYHPRLFSEFTGHYISALKRLAKKDFDRWQCITVGTCTYLLTAAKDDSAAEELSRPMLRYLRTLDEEEWTDFQRAIVQAVPLSHCNSLFDDVRRKEGWTEKLGGFFHRK